MRKGATPSLEQLVETWIEFHLLYSKSKKLHHCYKLQVIDIIQCFSTARAIALNSVPLRLQDKITLATDVTEESIIGIINLYTRKFTTIFVELKNSLTISCSCIPSHTKDRFLGAHVRSCRGLPGTA